MVERIIQQQVFAQLWDKLTPDQRMELLQKIDPNDVITDKAGLAAMTGAAALAALSTTVIFTGFAFYTAMSVTLCSAAGFLGVTLPFAAYTTSSSVVAFLSGPVGWAIAGLLLVGGIALAGRANLKETLPPVSQLHMLKVAALIAAGVDEKSVFH